MKVALLLLFSLLELSLAATDQVYPPPDDTINPHQSQTNYKPGDYKSNIPPAYPQTNDYPPKYPSSNKQPLPYQPANYSPPNRYQPTNYRATNNYQPPSYRPTKYVPQSGYYKPGMRNLGSVGGLSGLINLGLPASVRQQYRPRYTPYAQQTQYTPYVPQAQYKAYVPQTQYPQQTKYKVYPPQYRAPPQQYKPAQQYPQTYQQYPGQYPRYPGYNYNPGVKDLSRYGGIRGLVRLGLPRTVLYH